jgi:hypothetical protein
MVTLTIKKTAILELSKSGLSFYSFHRIGDASPNIYNIVLFLTNRRSINKNNRIISKGDQGEELSETCGDYRRGSCHPCGNWERGLLGEFDSREVFLSADLLSWKRYESIPIPDRSPH